MHPIINFLNDRKAAWLKAKKLDEISDAIAKDELQREADERFSLAAWLPDAAKRAGQLSMASHPSKFSHPSAKTSSIIATNPARKDGYLRTGNAEYALDVFGNAAAMDVYKFLSLAMDDGQTVLAHLEAETDAIKSAIQIPNTNFDDLKQGFLAVKTSATTVITDGLVKQVYFPVFHVNENKLNEKVQSYHVLSTLTPSGMLARIKRQIDEIRFGEVTKEAKEARKKNESHSKGYEDILGLTVTGYGGTKPQNISVLNSQNGGVAYLLPCLPPTLAKRDIRLPKHDFFSESLRLNQFRELFMELHCLMASYQNNVAIRNEINQKLNEIIDEVLMRAFSIRETYDAGWSDKEYYQDLPQAQRIWLDNRYSTDRTATDEWATGKGKRDKNHTLTREDDDIWLDTVIDDCAQWVCNAYRAILKQKAISLGDDELNAIRIMVDEALTQDKELFV